MKTHPKQFSAAATTLLLLESIGEGTIIRDDYLMLPLLTPSFSPTRRGTLLTRSRL
jgi:hypothetical protein